MAAVIAARRRRNALAGIRRPLVFHDFVNPLGTMTDDQIVARYRLNSALILYLLDTIGPSLVRKTKRNHAIQPLHQIIIALRFFATGSFQLQIGDLLKVSKSTVSRCIRAVSKAIKTQVKNIKFERSPPGSRKQKVQFFKIANFPNVLGCVDGTMIPIKPPAVTEDEPSFVCRKNFHALNIQGVCDSELRFINIVAKYPGSTHDAFIFNNCTLKDELERGLFGDGWLLGDSGSYLLTPVTNPTTPAEERYNKAHCKTRCCVERMFGVLKSRFRCLHKSGGCLNYRPEVCIDIIVACAKLHNLCRDNGLPDPDIDDDVVESDETEAADFQGEATLDSQRVRQTLITQRF